MIAILATQTRRFAGSSTRAGSAGSPASASLIRARVWSPAGDALLSSVTRKESGNSSSDRP